MRENINPGMHRIVLSLRGDFVPVLDHFGS